MAMTAHSPHELDATAQASRPHRHQALPPVWWDAAHHRVHRDPRPHPPNPRRPRSRLPAPSTRSTAEHARGRTPSLAVTHPFPTPPTCSEQHRCGWMSSVGAIGFRCLKFDAKTPWSRVRWVRGRGTCAHSSDRRRQPEYRARTRSGARGPRLARCWRGISGAGANRQHIRPALPCPENRLALVLMQEERPALVAGVGLADPEDPRAFLGRTPCPTRSSIVPPALNVGFSWRSGSGQNPSPSRRRSANSLIRSSRILMKLRG